jgi:predicted DCC family thiol-disulfide oxidoreductase YuxK
MKGLCPLCRANETVLIHEVSGGRLLLAQLTLPNGTQVDHPRGLATSGVNQAAAADVKKIR